jgi:hypothetical protein
MRIFQTQHDDVEHTTAEAAIASVEKRGSGSVVAFIVTPNQPGRLPANVYSSCGLWSYNRDGNGKWQAHEIYDGHGRPYSDERPN